MDGFLIYLIVINIVAFVLFTIDFFIACRDKDLDDGLINGSLLCIPAVAGGAVGMVLALFIWTSFLGGKRINKENIAWWFISFVCLIIWGAICAWHWGLLQIDPSIQDFLTIWNVPRLRILGLYLAIINVVTFGAFCIDKIRAMEHHYRIREVVLLGLALLGGSLGGIIGSRLAHHKTDRSDKWYFVYGMPFFIILHCALFIFAHLCGII